MNHEILFRGKRLDNGDWIEGFYIHLYDGKGNESHRIYTGYAETDCGEYYPIWLDVDPTTIGRYTGLTDKNGVRIFEGDIIHYVYGPGEGFWNADQLSVIAWGHTGFKLDGIKGTNKYALMQGWLVSIPCPEGAFEVIGNIHDDPKLLKGAYMA